MMVSSNRSRGNGKKFKYSYIPSEWKKELFAVRVVEQVFQGVSIHGDIQNVPGSYPWQPALDDPA